MTAKKISFTKSFLKDLKKAPNKVQKQVRLRLEIFISDPYHPLLNNHSLTGKYSPYKSKNITGDWRAIYKEFEDGEICFLMLGIHSKLYR